MKRSVTPCVTLLLVSPLVFSAAHGAEKKGKTPPDEAAASAALTADAPRLMSLKARSIGPAIMGGRVSDIALDPKSPWVFYVGLGTGGIMKTSNAGTTFSAIFEKEGVASVGAIAVAPSNPKVIWVGSGEANDRNSSSWGGGVYRSTNGGETFANVGLASSRMIARLVVPPNDPDTAYVAAMGDMWQPGGERGLFKTKDGGKTWTRVFSAPAPDDAKTGCGDVVMDPANPDTLYAALYARQRTPWSFTYGAAVTGGRDVGGVFKTTDGGATWRKLANGLPPETGRIGLSVHAKDPRIVMAVVQSGAGGEAGIEDIKSRRGGVFRSEDGGETWKKTSPLNPRPFYFSQIRIDPANDRRVYLLGFALHVSDDGGATFREDLSGKVHPDLHALAITPEELREEPAPDGEKKPRACKRLVLGTDGGLYQSFDGGSAWEHLNNFAAGEFYRIALDGSTPYRIAGGLQDNQNWLGPSRTLTKDGIVNSDWIDLGGGDGFYCVFDESDPNVLYVESQQGELHRNDLRTGEIKRLRPNPSEGQPHFRYHWNSPLIGSKHEKGTLYLAGNRVFKLTRRAEEWKLISPDLTRNDPEKTRTAGSGAENFGVVYTLAESPVQKGLLWAGTDDGKLWRTDDEGAHWVDLSANVPSPAKGEWMSRIEPSAFDAKVAYLAVDAHRSGRLAPLVFRTGDSGATWQSVAGNLPVNGPVKVVREDAKSADVFFAGTEFGLFVSFDRGGAWTKLGDLPTVAVDDIQLHPRERDLVVATHGRSLYVLDDVTPLEELAGATQKDVHLFPPRAVSARYLAAGAEEWTGKAAFRGKNPAEGALLTFWVKEYTGESYKIAIANASGQPVAELKGIATPGLNRVSWDLRRTKDFAIEYRSDKNKLVPSGEYTVTLTIGKQKDKAKLAVSIAEGIETD